MSYEARPGSVAYRALVHLQGLPPGTEVMSTPLAEAIRCEPASALVMHMKPLLEHGMVFRRQKDKTHVRAPFFWSLTDHSKANGSTATVSAACGSQKPDGGPVEIATAKAGSGIHQGRGSHHVLKAEAERPDATDRETPVNASPRVGAMGAGQAAYEAGDERQRTKAGLLDLAKRTRANTFARTAATEGPPGQPSQHRADREPVEYGADGANKRSVWTVATEPFKEAHFATFPPALITDCIKAGCPEGGLVLDPFGGAGTTGLVADRLQRNALLIELNPQYIEIAKRRIAADAPLFAEVVA